LGEKFWGMRCGTMVFQSRVVIRRRRRFGLVVMRIGGSCRLDVPCGLMIAPLRIRPPPLEGVGHPRRLEQPWEQESKCLILRQ